MDDINLHAGYQQGFADGSKDRERLAKQNKIMREALQKIMDDQRSMHETTITSSVWVSNTFKIAHDALKAADEVSEGEK